uniref:SWI/SNF-like complex subunit BAF250 C-terminal domain-containing protein n=1 Tax=Panagrolaimus sp. JU765 TaxID=591449 RepID=A0AC34Q1R8_9BILA
MLSSDWGCRTGGPKPGTAQLLFRPSYLLDVANQLLDDAFTVLSVVSGSLNMYDMEPDISYQILDSLLHWTVSKSIMARDPLTPWGNISPGNFYLEIIGKMTVLEKNVDMLLSTG